LGGLFAGFYVLSSLFDKGTPPPAMPSTIVRGAAAAPAVTPATEPPRSPPIPITLHAGTKETSWHVGEKMVVHIGVENLGAVPIHGFEASVDGTVPDMVVANFLPGGEFSAGTLAGAKGIARQVIPPGQKSYSSFVLYPKESGSFLAHVQVRGLGGESFTSSDGGTTEGLLRLTILP
jgi:hypothetical protein